MTPQELLEQIKIYVDLFIKESKMGGTPQHLDITTALGALEHELNRRELEKESR